MIPSAVEAAMARIASNLPAIGTGDEREPVHQARVGFHRLGVLVRAFRGVLDVAWRKDIETRAGALSDGLGRIRDADVMHARVEHVLSVVDTHDGGASEVLHRMYRRKATTRSKFRARMTAEDRVARLAELVDATAHLSYKSEAPPGNNELLVVLRRSIAKLDAAVEGLDVPAGPKDLHSIRILTKRARYVALALEGLIEPDGKAFLEEAAALQTELGDMHDAHVCCERLERDARTGSVRGAFVAGQVAQIEAESIRRSVDSWMSTYGELRERAGALR